MGIAKNYYDGLFYNDPIWCIALLCLYHIFLWSHITINVYEEFMCELGRKKTINANYWSWKVVNSYKRERRKPQVSRWLRRHEICISIWLVRSRSGFFCCTISAKNCFLFCVGTVIIFDPICRHTWISCGFHVYRIGAWPSEIL